MFNVSEDGTLIYEPDNTDESVTDDLFQAPLDEEAEDLLPPSPAPDGEGALEDPAGSPYPSPSIAPDGMADLFASPSPAPVAGLDITSGELSVTTSGDIYIYPETAEMDIPDDRSATAATARGLPNATSLSYLEDVARGYPSWYKYMSFKTDDTYSQSQVLWIGEKAEKNPSQNRIDFTNVDRIEVNYIRQSSSSSYYQYTKTHYDSYQVAYNTDVFLYTNAVSGYAQFDLNNKAMSPGIIFLLAAAALIALIFRGGGRQ